MAANEPQKSASSLAENYINIRYQTDFYQKPFASFVGDHSEWYRYKFLSVQAIPHWMFSVENIRGIIIEAINQGNYIFCNVNTKYISNYENYGQEDKRHSITIYGYSGDELLICDYFDYQIRQNGKCSFVEFTYALLDYIAGVQENRNTFLPSVIDHLNGVLLFKPRADAEKFEPSKMLYELRSFLEPDILLQQNQKISYGIGFFTTFCDFLKSKDNNYTHINPVKSLQLIYTHALLMEMRVRYVNKNYFENIQSLHDGFKELRMTANIIRNSYIKAAFLELKNMGFYSQLALQIYEFYRKYQELIYLFAQNLNYLI